jgi:hypothetical protein
MCGFFSGPTVKNRRAIDQLFSSSAGVLPRIGVLDGVLCSEDRFDMTKQKGTRAGIKFTAIYEAEGGWSRMVVDLRL